MISPRIWPVRPVLLRTVVPLAGGTCIALAAAILMRMSPVWLAMLVGGALVAIPAFLVEDRTRYWLILLLAVLPFDVMKVFMQPEHGLALVDKLGAPAGPLSPYVHVIDLAFLPLFVTWGLGKIRRRERVWFPAIHWLPVAFLALTAVKAPTALDPYFAVLGILKQLKYVVIYVVAADALHLRRYGWTILTVLMLTLGMQGATTIARYEFQDFKPVFGQALGRTVEEVRGEAKGTRRIESSNPDSPNRGFGTFYHANVTAMHLELLLPFALILAIGSRSRRLKAFAALMFLLGITGHFLTFSRAGLVALLGSMALCLGLAVYRGLIPRRWIPAVAIATGIVAVTAVPIAKQYMETRPAETAFHEDHVREGLTIAMQNPWFGVGLNNSSFARKVLLGDKLFYLENMLPIHSQHLIILCETGVIGYTLFMGFVVLVALEALRRSRSPSLLVQVYTIGVLGAFCAIGIHVTTDWLGFEASHVMLWLYAGLIVGLKREPLPDPGPGALRGEFA